MDTHENYLKVSVTLEGGVLGQQGNMNIYQARFIHEDKSMCKMAPSPVKNGEGQRSGKFGFMWKKSRNIINL